MNDLERISELLSYDPETGILRWKVDRGAMKCEGRVAGCEVRYGRTKYVKIWTQGKNASGHRIAWLLSYGYWPKGQIDHINGDGLDNQLCNLRDVTASQNNRNRMMKKTNKSGVTGVSFNKEKAKWRAIIRVEGKDKCIGYFKSLEDAAAARKAANLKYGYSDRHGLPIEKAPDDVSEASVVQCAGESQ